MSTIFIGWGGNEPLAKELEKKLKASGHNIICGGGTPRQMFVGSQIIEQMKSCDRAILLVEEYKNSGISTNLMYEWGYLVGYRRIKRIHVFLIDKSKSDLPSDLEGVWAEEVSRKIIRDKIDSDIDQDQNLNKDIKENQLLAQEIYDKFIDGWHKELPVNYFDIIDNWQYISRDLENDKDCYNTAEFAEYIVVGCLAAYYYNDNERFRSSLEKIKGSGRIGDIVSFAKIYVDVFLKSGDMACSVKTSDYMCAQIVNKILSRTREYVSSDDSEQKPSVLDDLIDILCYDILGLVNLLSLKDRRADNEHDSRIEKYRKDALDNFNKTIELIDQLEIRLKESSNQCLIYLLRSYIYNDLAHLYKDSGDNTSYEKYLDYSVDNRFSLTYNFQNEFPKNVYLYDKLQQEYSIAYSEQCCVNGNGEGIELVNEKYKEWERMERSRKSSEYTNTLLGRIKTNIDYAKQKHII